MAGARRFGTPGYWTLGGGLAGERDFGRRALAVDVTAETGSAAASLGRVRTTSVSLSVALLQRQPLGPVVAEAGGGARVGLVRLAGESDDPEVLATSHSSAWGGPAAYARLLLPLGGWVVCLGAELGYAFGPGALVAGDREMAVDGTWINVQLGVGASL